MTRLTIDDLRPHQKEALDRLIARKRALLLMETGLGKTAVILFLLDRLFSRVPSARVLLASYKGVVTNVWEREAAKWEGPHRLQFHRIWEAEGRAACIAGAPGIYLANWERLTFVTDNAKEMPGFHACVFDESSALKSRSALRARQAMAISKPSPIVVLMDGTPRSGGIHELWTQMRIAQIEGVPRYAEFEEAYCERAGNGRLRDKPKAGAAFVARYGDDLLTYRAADWAKNLPEMIETTRHVTLPDDVYLLIQDLEDQLATFIDGQGRVEAKSARAVVTKIEQLYNGRALSGTPDDAHREVLRVHDEKLNNLARLVAELDGEPLLVAARYRADAQAIVERIPGAVVATAESVGGILADWQAGKIPVLVANPASLGHGVDGLQTAHHIAFYSQTWSAAKRKQTIARLLRSGQTRPVVVHDILIEGRQLDDGRYRKSLEEICRDRVAGNLDAEETMLAELVRHASGAIQTHDNKQETERTEA